MALQASERNLRRALLMFETCKVAQNPLQPHQEMPYPDWELYIKASSKNPQPQNGFGDPRDV